MQADLSLVIPTFNEEQRLPRTLARLDEFARETSIRLHVVVSDDGSTDGTCKIARQHTDHNDDWFEVELSENPHRGKGAAVREGMHRVKAPIVGCFDADLSPGTDAIEKLYKSLVAGGDMAISSRGLPDSVIEVHPAWYRELAGRIFNFLLRKMADIPFRDTQCGLKLWRAEVAEEVFRHQRLDGFAFDAELVVLAARLGFDVKEVPVRWAHTEGSKLSMLRDSVRMSRDVLRIVRRLDRGQIHAPGVPTHQAMDAMSRSEDRHWWYQAKRQLVTSNLQAAPYTIRCLDVGCGGGAMVAEAGRSRLAFGVDLSTQALDHARARGLVRLVRAEAGNLPFARGSFDAALLLDVLEHHARPEQLLREIRNVLAPEGILLITVPAFQWMWSYADHVLGHYRRYTRHTLKAELESSGYTLQRLTYFHSWLLPIAWVFRKLRTLFGSTDSADDFEVPAALNRLLLKISQTELKLMRSFDLPFGLSVLAVAQPAPQDADLPGATLGAFAPEPLGSSNAR
ncbi:MAG: glycosyltransferase [Actinomycetota bacterium]